MKRIYNWIRWMFFPYDMNNLQNTVLLDGRMLVVKNGMHTIIPVKIVTTSAGQAAAMIHQLSTEVAGSMESEVSFDAERLTDTEAVERFLESFSKRD